MFVLQSPVYGDRHWLQLLRKQLSMSLFFTEKIHYGLLVVSEVLSRTLRLSLESDLSTPHLDERVARLRLSAWGLTVSGTMV